MMLGGTEALLLTSDYYCYCFRMCEVFCILIKAFGRISFLSGGTRTELLYDLAAPWMPGNQQMFMEILNMIFSIEL